MASWFIPNQYYMYALYTICVVAAFKMAKRPMKKLQKKSFAIFMNLVYKKYNAKMHNRKQALFSEMVDMTSKLQRPLEILEIGAGSGANFKYYPKRSNIICADPNPFFERYIKKNSDDFPDINLKEFVICKAEDMSQILNSGVDVVVCTLVMCSVDDVEQSLREIKRVLRPGGKFFFMEHVAADPNTTVYTIQRLLNPVWGIIGDGCSLVRDTWRNIETAGFSSVAMERFTVQYKSTLRGLGMPPILRPHCSGVATK